MKALSIFALIMTASTPVLAQDAPAGAAATACDSGSFTAVRSERTGEILYWTNSTCETAESDGDMMGGMMGSSMGDMGGGMGDMGGGMGDMDGGMGGGMGEGM